MTDKALIKELKSKDCVPNGMKSAPYIYKAKACGFIAVWDENKAAVCWDGEALVFGRVVFLKGLMKYVIELDKQAADDADMDYVYDLDGFEV